MICPKCKYERTEDDTGASDQCPVCGANYKAAIAQRKRASRQPPPPPQNIHEFFQHKFTWREAWPSVVLALLVVGYLAKPENSPNPPAKSSSTPPPAVQSLLPPPRKIVANSTWDASVSQVEAYLKRYLKDPDSYQSIEWSPVSELPDGKGFIVRHMYRAKNSFGGYTIDNKIFLLDAQGNVLLAADAPSK